MPDGGAEKLLGGQVAQSAEVQHLVFIDETLLQHIRHGLVVVTLLLRRHQPPDGITPRQQDPGAIELLQQQDVLGRAAAFVGQILGTAVAEGLGIDEEEVHLQAESLGPLLQVTGLVQQQALRLFIQLRVVTDPDVQVALGREGDGAGAAH